MRPLSKVAPEWWDHASNNVAKNVINFSIAISREQLRPNYGEGFKGAPLVTTRISPRVPDQTGEVNHNEQKASNTAEVDRTLQL